jgi:hypothetical protein
MFISELFLKEDHWSGGETNTYHTGNGAWNDGTDNWHNPPTTEDFATSNLIQNETADMSDILTARELISNAVEDPINSKHKYFEFLKHLRTKYGSDYSTKIHQHAAKLAMAKESN